MLRGACSPKWFTGSTSLSFGPSSSLHLVWWPDCQTANAKKRMSRIQRLACLGITGAMCTTPMGAWEVLTCLPSLDLVVQGEVRSAAHPLWSLGCWSYLHPNCGHSAILMQLQKSDHIFSMGNGIKRPAYNFEPKYRVMLTKQWTKVPGSPHVVKGLPWYKDGSRMQGPESMGNPWVGGSASL